MSRWLLLVSLLIPLWLPVRPEPQAPPVQSGQFRETELADWLQGSLASVYVEGGDLRLQPEQTAGTYESQAFRTPFGVNAAVLQWHAAVTAGQTLTLELRSSGDGLHWVDWQPVVARPDRGGGSISQLFVLQPSTAWLQYRVRFGAASDSPALQDVTLTYLNSTAGPALVDIANRVPPNGPAALTPPPPTITGVDWGAIARRGTVAWQQPRRVELTEIRAPAGEPNSAATVRALQWAALNLEQWDVLPYHFLIDGAGTIYQGAGSAAMLLPEVAAGTVEIGLLADTEHEGLSEAARSSLNSLLGWLGDAYRLDPASLAIAPTAPPQLRNLTDELRAGMDRATVRSTYAFAYANTATGASRVSLLNRGPDEARVTLTGVSSLGIEPRSLAVPGGARVDLTLNSTFPVSGPLSLEVRADRVIEAERTELVGRETQGGLGARRLARVWYFADGSSAAGDSSSVELFNPHERDVVASVTLFPAAASPVSRTFTLAARSRQSVALDQLRPGGRFGIKVIAAEPLAAERTQAGASGPAYITPGVAELSRRWLFAEGSTMTGYTTTLALFNPWPQQVGVTLRVLSEDGTSLDRRYAIAGEQQTLLTLNDIVPELPFAMEVIAERPLAAERLIRFDNGRGATAGPGAARPATRWVFVEGSTAKPAEEFLLVLNPNTQPVGLDVAYTLPDGRVERRRHTVGAGARLAILANADVPDAPVLTAVVTGDRPVVVERTIYVNSGDGRGGETSLGIPGD